MFSDWPVVFSWYLLLLVLSTVCLPLSLTLFSKFWDRGYFLAKIIAILLSSYLVWLLGILKVLPFSQTNAWAVVAFLAIINLVIFKQKYLAKAKSLFKKYEKIWVSEEILFFVCLFLWTWIRGFQPDIHGLEKFMDYGFVNSILRSQFFPPKDMWLSGYNINYYYFGHLVSAVLTKLSGLQPALTYNLMIATLFALVFLAGFVIGGQLVVFLSKKRKYIILGGLLAAILLNLGGNLQPVWYFFKNKTLTGYWYPDATRFLVQKFGAADNTIHEFPIYSFVVADLHGHLLDLPFVLLFLALLLSGFMENSLATVRSLLPLSLLLGVMSMTNFWDLPIYLLFLGTLLFWRNYQKYGKTLETIYQTALFSILYLLFAILYSLPFHLNFESIAKGISLVDFRSPPWMLLFLWGAPLAYTLVFLFFSRKHLFIQRQKKVKSDDLILILLFVAWFLIIVPEFIYVKDIYIHSYQRANTMFKLTYQSFVIFSLAASYIFIRILTTPKKDLLEILGLAVQASLFLVVMIYPCFAIKSYYGLQNYRGLDGEVYLANLYSEDYQGILWLKENIQGQPVILEAVGESYTDYARVSANTGLPTIVGWPVHEWLWRGSYDEAGKRRAEVQKVYELGDRSVLEQYQVEYLFLGVLERKQYEIDEEKIDQLGKVVFQEGETKIYQLKE